MKKILVCLILVLSLVLSACDTPSTPQDNTDASQNNNSNENSNGENDNPSQDNNGGTSSDTESGNNSSGGNDNDSSNNSGNPGTSGGNDGDNTDGGNGSDNDENDGGNTGTSCETREDHTDIDNNGLCDSCTESVLVEFNFFVLNDFHGKMTDSDTQPGADELSMYLRDCIEKNPNSILMSSGDMWQGGSESNLTKGLIVTDWMNELNFVAMTLGNHEYDWGEEYIIANDELAEFPLLAINIYDRTTNKRVSYCQPSVMVDVDGLQIGIIGAIGDCYSSISSDKVQNVYFKVGDELTALVKAESQKLRAAGADFIIYSLHDGYGNSKSSGYISNSYLESYYDPTLSSGDYVDLVFEGHTHQTYNLVDYYGVYHLQGGGDNRGLTQAEVFINFANGNTSVTRTQIISNSIYENYEDDPFFEELFDKYADEIAKGDEVLGINPYFIPGDDLKQLIAELYYDLGMEVWGDEYDIALGGGYISIRSPYNLYAGEVKYSDLMMLFPFDNELVLCSIKGKDLKEKFFETTNSNYFIAYGDYGESIKDNIDNNQTYYVIVDMYSAQYAPNNLTVIEEYDPTVFARDLLAEYIKNGGLEN